MVLAGVGVVLSLSGCTGRQDDPQPAPEPEQTTPTPPPREPEFLQNPSFSEGNLDGWEIVLGEGSSAVTDVTVEENMDGNEGYVAQMNITADTDTQIYLVQTVEASSIKQASVRARQVSGSDGQLLLYVGQDSSVTAEETGTDSGDERDSPTNSDESSLPTTPPTENPESDFRVVSFDPTPAELTSQWEEYEIDVEYPRPDAVLAVGLSVPAGTAMSVLLDRISVTEA